MISTLNISRSSEDTFIRNIGNLDRAAEHYRMQIIEGMAGK
jgi:hypothetical protein